MQVFLTFIPLILLIIPISSYVVVPLAEPYELEEFLAGVFQAKGLNGTWISGNEFLYQNSDGGLNKFNVQTQTNEVLIEKSALEDYDGPTGDLSADQLYFLIKYNETSIFRHSTTAQYAIYDIKNDKYYDIANKTKIQLATWSPKGHNLVYVYENNIYYLEEPENVNNPITITTNGVPGIVYNGVSDWVYEEEVLGSPIALWFSPNGRNLAFATFNDTNVHEMNYFIYGTPGLDNLYPTLVKLRYPKVGTPNPTVSTSIVNFDNPSDITEIKSIPERFLPEDYIFYGMKWPLDDEVVVLSMNRVQNKGELMRCKTDGNCVQEKLYEETNGWLDIKLPKYSKDGTRKLEILPQPEGDDFYNHIVLTDDQKNSVERITSGQFVVLDIYGWDEDNNLIYFEATVEGNPSQQHVYSINPSTLEKACLSCDLVTPTGYCTYAKGVFSEDFSYFVNYCQGTGPNYMQFQNALNLNEAVLWEDNHELLARLALKTKPIIQEYSLDIGTGHNVRVKLLIPPEFDYTLKYPAIVNVYAGPDSNQISDAYSAGIQNYWVTNRKYIYVYIDGRGSGRDNRNKMFQIYRKMGTVEIDDQIAVVRHLVATCPYIDSNNIGIWGWSYGGFSTAWVMAKDNENLFKFGLSVAPVTNFIYYDSIYTERYMGLPSEDDNSAGYNGTDVTRKAENFRGKSYFLIHGNADDNVHYQQSMLLSRALELADVPFRQQSYPDENHSLGHVGPHLYHTIDNFFANQLNLPDQHIISNKIKYS